MFALAIFLFFFNDTATTEIYTLSLHDALPISPAEDDDGERLQGVEDAGLGVEPELDGHERRSEEHTSELQSQSNLVCRLLLEKKKQLLPASGARTHCLTISTSRS